MRPFRTQANRASACRFPRTMLARPARAGQESPRPLDSATLVEAQSRGKTRQAAPRRYALATQVRGVAQPGRAPGSGPGGRRFKSSLPDQCFQSLADQRPRPPGLAQGFYRQKVRQCWASRRILDARPSTKASTTGAGERVLHPSIKTGCATHLPDSTADRYFGDGKLVTTAFLRTKPSCSTRRMFAR